MHKMYQIPHLHRRPLLDLATLTTGNSAQKLHSCVVSFIVLGNRQLQTCLVLLPQFPSSGISLAF